ncbi:MAG: hypothetical protein WDO68_28275 [Gammaproteobacteria bacterium]
MRATKTWGRAVLLAASGILATHSAAGQTARGDVFATRSPDYYNVDGAAWSVRHDAANGTGAPQIGLDPSYPSSVPAWEKIRTQSPRQAQLFQPCVEQFIQATDEIRRVAPGMRRPVNASLVNGGVKRANALIKAGDECMRSAESGKGIVLRGGVSTEGEPENGGGSPPNGGVRPPDFPYGVPGRTPRQGGTPTPRDPGTGGNPSRPGGGTPTGPTQPTQPGPDDLPLPPPEQQQLRRLAGEVQRIADDPSKGALAATNRFFRCLAEAIAADLQFLAQPGYVPAQQMAQSLHEGTWNYLTSNAYENNRQMFEGAVRALQNFQNDPACGFANLAPAAAQMAITHRGPIAATAGRLKNAANALKKINTDNIRRIRGFGTPRHGSPARGINPFNPECAPNMCFPSAFAELMSEETGEKLAAMPYAGNVETQIVKGVPTQVYNITHEPTVQALLRDFVGERPLQGPKLSTQRLENQRWGKPSSMSVQDISNELRRGGPGARGMVFIEYPPTPENPLGTGHVVVARNVTNAVGVTRIQFTDPSNAGMNAAVFFEGAAGTSLYRFK